MSLLQYSIVHGVSRYNRSYSSDGVTLLFVLRLTRDIRGIRGMLLIEEQPNISQKTLFQCHFAFPHKSHADCPRIKPRHAWFERLAANRLSHDAAFLVVLGRCRIEMSRFFQSICKFINLLVLSRRDFCIYNLAYACLWQLQPFFHALVQCCLKSLWITVTSCLWRDGCVCVWENCCF